MKWKIQIKITGSHDPEIFRNNTVLNPYHAGSLIEDYRHLVYRSILDGQTEGKITDQTGWLFEYDGDKPFEELTRLNKERILFNALFCYKRNGEI